MTSIDDYELMIRRSIFRKRIKPEGMSKRWLKMACALGIMSPDEKNVLIYFTTGDRPKVDNLNDILYRLESDGYIKKSIP